MLLLYTLAVGAFMHAPVEGSLRPSFTPPVRGGAFGVDTIAKDSSRARSDTTSRTTLRRPAVLSPTVVTGTGERQRRTESSATIDVIGGKEIDVTRPTHPASIMNRIPGVHISELSAEGHSTAIRQPLTTKPMYLYLEDGIPTRATGFFNHNALYEINLPQSGGIEVLKGPGTALYGSDAVGGVINVLSKVPPARPSVETTLETGSFGWLRSLSSGGFRTARNSARFDLNLTRSKGWQNDAPYNRKSGTARWDVVAPDGWFIKTLATATAVDQHDVPTISQSLFDVKSGFNSAPIAFREVRATRLSVALEKTGVTSLINITPYFRRNVLNLLPSWQISYDPQVWFQHNNSFGLLAKIRKDLPWIRGKIVSGIDADYSPGHFDANQAMLDTTPATTTSPIRFASYSLGQQQYNYDVTYYNVSPYTQIDASPASNVHIDLGVRYDHAGYKYETFLSPVNTGTHRIPANTSISYQHVSPKAGITVDVSPSLNVYGSYRHGFRAPSQGQLFQQNSAANTVALKPVQVNSAEVGVRGEVQGWLLYSIAAYDMIIKNDIISYRTAANTTEATNAGETRHRGVESSVGIEPHKAIRIDVSYSIMSQRYITWNPSSTVALGGNRIEQAPRDLGSLLVTYKPSILRGGRLAVETVRVGQYAMDPQNTQSYAGYTVAHLHANYIISQNSEIYARAANVLNKRYAEVATYTTFQQHQYTSGAPRAVYVGARYRLPR